MVKNLFVCVVAVGASVCSATDFCRKEPATFPVAAQRHAFFEPTWCSWNVGTAFAQRCLNIVKGMESYESMAGVYNLDVRLDKNGRLTYGWKTLDERLKVSPDRRLFFRIYSRVPSNPKQFFFGTFADERAAFEAWRQAHPGWLGFWSLEWGNDAYQIHRKPARLLQGDRSITSNELARLLKERPKPNTREQFVDGLLRPVFDRVVEWSMGDPANLLLGEAHYCIEHLAGYWGAGKLGIETTRDNMLWQIKMMFCRGAARQFSRPWLWYIASYSKNNSSRTATEYPKLHGPNYGISLAAIKRATYLTYLSGANWYEREGMGSAHFLLKEKPPRLSDEGLMYDAFYKFTKRFDRGTPYVPIALLVPANRGYTRLGGRAFNILDYTRPDFMLDAVMSVILDFPHNRRHENVQKNVERVMANSRYGDVFDALTPDFPDQTSFRSAIGDYRAAVLIGEYGDNPGMENVLRDYVSGGGTLVLNAQQMTKGFPASFTGVVPGAGWRTGARSFTTLSPMGAEVLKRDAEGRTLFTRHAYGKGRVVVCAEDWLVPWYGGDDAGQTRALQETQIGDPVRYPEIEWLFDCLEDDLLPVKVVSGDVQYGISRTKDGWAVYLINNGGVVKAWDRFEEIDPKGMRVELDVSRIPHVTAVEHVVGADVEMRGDHVVLTVPSGDVRVVEIR